MKFKVVLLKELHPSGMELLQANDCEVVISHGSSEADYINDMEGAHGIFVRNEPITPAMMDATPTLKVIAKHGAGYDNIDVKYATKKGIRVVYVPGGNTIAVAEHAMMMILNCARRINYVQNQFKNDNYNIRYSQTKTHELSGQTLGILGCGHIGQEVAKKAALGFDMKVIGYSEHTTQEQLDNAGIPIQLVKDRNEIFSQSDFISIHLPATPEHVHSIGKEQFKLMKKTAHIINTARGNIIDESALINALKSKTIMGAGLDVFEKEPPEHDNPLLAMENVIVTPHCAGMTLETSRRLSRIGAQGILEVLYNKPITYPVV